MTLSRYLLNQNSTLTAVNSTLTAVKVLFCYYLLGVYYLRLLQQSLLVCDHFDLDESALGKGLDSYG